MKYPAPLIRGRLLRRYKRFLADVEIVGDDGPRRVTVHCANPGSMMGLTRPGAEVWLSPAANPARKLKYTWELVRVGRTLVGVNPALANRLAEEAIAAGRIAELAGYDDIRREVRYGARSRIDLLLGQSAPRDGAPDDAPNGRSGPIREPVPEHAPVYVEVKSVTLRRPPSRRGEFPDAVTARGARHLRELADIVAGGGRAAMLYVVQRADCEAMTVAADIDPDYAAAVVAARASGVEIYCYACKVGRGGIRIAAPLPVDWPR